VGAVAVALGLVAEAQKLFAGCGRYDLLNKLHQAAGEWDKVQGNGLGLGLGLRAAGATTCSTSCTRPPASGTRYKTKG
jgi:hypothetical protein